MGSAGLSQRMAEPRTPAHHGTPVSMRTRMLLLLVVVLSVSAVVALLGVPERAAIEQRFRGAGVLGGLGFVLLYAALALAPVPKAVLSVAGGAVFGFPVGIALVLLGSLVGASTAFALARLLGRDAVERWAGPSLARVDDLVRDRGALTMIGLRLVPVVPFTALNYGAGLSAMPVRAFLVGTAVGIAPGTAGYVALGAYGVDLVNAWTLSVGALLAAVILAVVLLRRR